MPAQIPAALFCALAGLVCVGATLHCAMRREISPCTCRREDNGTGTIIIDCHRINSFEDVANALTNKFSPETKIVLDLSYSQLPDFEDHNFKELGLSITKLKLNYNNLSELKESIFQKMDLVDFLSLSDNPLQEMPRHILSHVPHVKTLDMCRNKITKLTADDFKDIQELEALLIADNQITKIERNAMPKVLKQVHFGVNKLNSLNGALRDLDRLDWIFINSNNLRTIENELPVNSREINFIHAAHNELTSLPQDLKQMTSLESLYFYKNNIVSLNRALQKSKKLQRIGLSFNCIETLAEDEFTEAETLAELDLAYNRLKSLNHSLRSLKSLRYVNLTHNFLTEFSFQEIKGLKWLSMIDLSFNKISHISGNMENVVDAETHVLELRLDHNYLYNLGGALSSLRGLLSLNLSNNQLEQISSEDLIGLDELKILDISYNRISSLAETSKAFLPSLEELRAHHNNITVLEKNFHGLPSLCTVDLSYNQIHTITEDLLSKSQCIIKGVLSTMKIYLQDNPVLCSERIFYLVSVFRNSNARISGSSTCVAPQTAAPTNMRTMNDVSHPEDQPLIIVAQVDGNVRSMESDRISDPQLEYKRVTSLMGHLLPGREGGFPVLIEPPVTLPPSNNVVVKWPDHVDDKHSHPLADQLRLRDINSSTE